MVVSAQRLASQVGLDILKQGGNAVDAAVAVGYALAVTHPCCGNIGGGGFMLIHLASGKDTVIDFRETAPYAALPGMYLDTGGQCDPRCEHAPATRRRACRARSWGWTWRWANTAP